MRPCGDFVDSAVVFEYDESDLNDLVDIGDFGQRLRWVEEKLKMFFQRDLGRDRSPDVLGLYLRSVGTGKVDVKIEDVLKIVCRGCMHCEAIFAVAFFACGMAAKGPLMGRVMELGKRVEDFRGDIDALLVFVQGEKAIADKNHGPTIAWFGWVGEERRGDRGNVSSSSYANTSKLASRYPFE